ncbi:MAG: hypothetical protein ACYSX0_04695 [Planctomycetota bacterium]|jgi:hypothetical protein
MRELKRLFLLVLVLTFFGGVGTGAWIGTIVAAPSTPRPSLDDRVQDFETFFGNLDGRQTRVLREIIAEHDTAVARIRQRLSKEQFEDIRRSEDASRERIRAILTPQQRDKYDKRPGRR